jgi:hypothetical protein
MTDNFDSPFQGAPMPASLTPRFAANVRVMRTLLAKDWRLYRPQMISLLVLAAACYLIVAITGADYYRKGSKWARVIDTGAITSIFSTAVVASAFGGAAIASERADQSCNFIGVLPVTRQQIMLSKWLISFFAIGGAVLFHAGAMKLAAWGAGWPKVWPWWPFEWREYAPVELDEKDVAFWGGLAISLFGVAWLVSTFTRSAAICSAVSTAVTAGATMVFLFKASRRGYVLDTDSVLLFWIGVSAMAAGAIYYSRRVSP